MSAARKYGERTKQEKNSDPKLIPRPVFMVPITGTGEPINCTVLGTPLPCEDDGNKTVVYVLDL